MVLATKTKSHKFAGQTSSLEIQYLFNHLRNPTTYSMEPNIMVHYSV